MCASCGCATPPGDHELCPSCSIEVRVEARRGLAAVDRHLGGRAELERLGEQPPS